MFSSRVEKSRGDNRCGKWCHHDELMAIFGWTTKQQTTLYIKAANRKKLAKNAVHKLLREQKGIKLSHPFRGLTKVGQKRPKSEVNQYLKK
jgi:hypothetical protein